MKMISRGVHGYLDYTVALFLIASPWLFGFSGNWAATYAPVGVGFVALLYSLLTDYETGLFPVITFRWHLVFDVLAGAFLAASPWIFGFASVVVLPHVLLGLAEIATGVTSNDGTGQMRRKRANA